MPHEVEKMAYVNEVPWHGLGERLTPNASLELWQQEAGLDWEAVMAPIKYDVKAVGLDGVVAPSTYTYGGQNVLYRSDTNAPLGLVSDRYKAVQPKDVIEFYRELTEHYGFQMETAGVLKEGRRIWALANTHQFAKLKGDDTVKAYLLLATSYDGTMATQARFTSIRVVCHNTLTLAAQGRPDVTVPHNVTFDADSIKSKLDIGTSWNEFKSYAADMCTRPISEKDTVKLLLNAYYGLTNEEEIKQFNAQDGAEKRVERFLGRMQHALFNSPGAHLESARGMLWGVVQAVTFDVDHAYPARTRSNRLDKAWFGEGETIKNRTWEAAKELIG